MVAIYLQIGEFHLFLYDHILMSNIHCIVQLKDVINNKNRNLTLNTALIIFYHNFTSYVHYFDIDAEMTLSRIELFVVFYKVFQSFTSLFCKLLLPFLIIHNRLGEGPFPFQLTGVLGDFTHVRQTP